MKKILAFLVFMLPLVALVLPACSGGKELSQPRGRYIYDEANRLTFQSEISLASYLWRLDSQSGYEIVLVLPKNQLDEQDMIKWFNDYGVGKKDIDTGTAVFVLPDSSVFVGIGSGNDKVSVTHSKTYGERIFKDFNNDPVLTLLRFTSSIGGKINEGVGREIGSRAFDAIKNNLNLILLWAAVIALLIFLLQQFNGFQPHDLILPIGVFVALGAFLGISALSSNEAFDSYKTYGVITSIKRSTHDWIEMRTICTSTGKATTCYTVPVPHTDYINDVAILSYEFRDYGYRFRTTDSKGAWDHQVGELDSLVINIKSGNLTGVSGIDDNSGGKTIGDGVWILSGKNK